MSAVAADCSTTAVAAGDRCQLCDAAPLEPFVVPGRLELQRCSACGLYQNGRLPPGSAYEGNYHQGYARKRASKLRTAQVRLARIAACLPPAQRSAVRLLDVGCSVGCTLEAAQRRGWEAWGADVSDDALAYCRQRDLRCRRIQGEDLPFGDEEFEVLTAWHVIEHVADVRRTLTDWRRVLRPGGLLVLETPDAQCRKVRRRGAAYRRFWASEHTYTFARENLEPFVEQAGFQILPPPWRGDWRGLPLGMALYAAAYQGLRVVQERTGLCKAFQIFARRMG